ncbi:MAG: exonuclease SbcCD subunit D C-terminal domain-containing protein, partial [Psychrobacter sp.]
APIKETTKKIAAQTSEFMDDLFSFEELVENSESDKKLIDEEVSNRAEFILNTETSNLLHHDKSRQMQIVSLPIPKFQKLAQVSGDLATIKQMIDRTIDALTESVWLEVVYDGDEVVSDLREHIQAMVEGLPCEVLKIKNTQTYNKVLNQHQASETLQDLNEQEVFERCLTAHNVPDEQKTTLRDAYEQIVYNLHHEDTQAE